MIRIRVTKREGGVEISALGHAGYGPCGQDIVCAGVSALLYGLKAYLEGIPSIATAEDSRGAREPTSLRVREGDGELWMELHGSRSVYREALAVTLAGLSLITACYPAYVTLDINLKGDEYEPS